MNVTVALDRFWDGSPLPDGLGGPVELHGHGTAPQEAGRLRVTWCLAVVGSPRVPPGPAGFTEGLWEHDVVEVFLGAAGGGPPRYVELEVAASGHWLALAFDGVRRRSAELRDLDPAIGCAVAANEWRGTLDVGLAPLREVLGGEPATLLVAAALGDARGERVLACAPALPGEDADFHQPERWASLGPVGG